jgi:predicted Zn-dependent peptidase
MKNIRPELEKLKSGLRLVSFPLKGTDSVAVSVNVGAGSLYETKEISGISHFLEHLFFKGTKNRPSVLDIAKEIEGVGGEFNAFTSREYTAYYIKVASKHLQLALDILSDILQNSLFDKKEIEKERGVILEEINMYRDLPQRHILDVFYGTLFGDQAAGRSILGFPETIKNMSREQIFSYFQNFYQSVNIVISAAGQFDSVQLFSQVQKFFGKVEGKEQPQLLPFTAPDLKNRLKIVFKPTEQAHFIFGSEGASRNSPDRYPLRVLSLILGGGFTSRLWREIRDKRGWAYYVRTFTDNLLKTGAFGVWAGVKIKVAPEAVMVCLNEFQRVIKQGVSNEELQRAKEQIKGRTLLDMEDSAESAWEFGTDLLLEEKLETLAEYFAKIDAVTKKQVQAAAQKYLDPRRLHLALIGPFKDSKPFHKLIS